MQSAHTHSHSNTVDQRNRHGFEYFSDVKKDCAKPAGARACVCDVCATFYDSLNDCTACSALTSAVVAAATVARVQFPTLQPRHVDCVVRFCRVRAVVLMETTSEL